MTVETAAGLDLDAIERTVREVLFADAHRTHACSDSGPCMNEDEHEAVTAVDALIAEVRRLRAANQNAVLWIQRLRAEATEGDKGDMARRY